VQGRSFAWGLDFPGCLADGAQDSDAILNFARRVLAYEAWINLHTDAPWFTLLNPDFRIVEVAPPLKMASSRPRAFFADDRRPLVPADVEQALLVQRWQAEVRLAGMEFLPVEAAAQLKQESGSPIRLSLSQMARDIYEILAVLESALPSFPAQKSVLAQLEFTDALTQAILPAWAAKEEIITRNGELWSARKAIRLLLGRQRVGIDRIKTLVV
jgi:hypothetical protein